MNVHKEYLYVCIRKQKFVIFCISIINLQFWIEVYEANCIFASTWQKLQHQSIMNITRMHIWLRNMFTSKLEP